MADMEVDEPIVERDEEDVEGDEVEGLDVGEADDAVKFVEDEEFNSRTVDADVAWLLKIPNDLYERLAPIKVTDEAKEVAKLRYYSDGTFAFILPNEEAREQPVASSSKTPASQTAPEAEQDEKEITYDFRENVIPAKSSKWMYYEDERKHRYSGRTTERARPRLVSKVGREFTLARKMSAAASTRALKEANLRELQKKKRTQLIGDTNLTKAQQNILAGGGQLESGIMRKATEKKLEKKPVKERAYRILAQNLQDILYEEFNRYKYWKMNTLQERLQQPTSWIRQNLKAIAVREETGPYQNYWRLQDKFSAAQGEAEDVGGAPENQDYSDAALMAIKNEQVDEADGDGDMDEEDEDRKPIIGQDGQARSASQIDIAELSDAEDDGDEDSEMEEVDT